MNRPLQQLKITAFLFFSLFFFLASHAGNIALNKPSTSDSQLNSSYPASNAVDGINSGNSSRWVSANTAWPHYIEIDLEGAYDITGLNFYTGHNGYNRPVNYEFQYWNGNAWITIVSNSNNSDPTVNRTFSVVTTTRVRLKGTGGTDNYFRLFELEVEGTAIGGGTNQAPIASITSPASGASFTEGSDITISANATDSDGIITQVEFFDGSISLGVDASAPYSTTINSASSGHKCLTAVATDNDGALGTSAVVNVSVNPASLGGFNVVLGKPASTDSQLSSSYTASNAVDGVNVGNNTRWISANTSWPHYIEVDLEGSFDITGLKFWTGYNGYNYPVKYQFQYWDGAAWTTILNKPNNTSAVVNETFAPVNATKVRLYGTGGNDKYFRLYEFEVEGTEAVGSDPNIDPVADFSFTPTSGSAPITVSFDASTSSDSDGSIALYSWDYGDGSYGTGVTSSHTYQDGGSYNVILTVVDNDRALDTQLQIISLNNSPLANISLTPSTGDAPLGVIFNASNSTDSDGSIVSYAWDFGDGSTSSSSTGTHTYATSGRYKIVLIVTDNSGASDIAVDFVKSTNLVVQFAGDYLPSSKNFRDGQPIKTSGLDIDNDGMSDDASVEYPFSTTTPLSPLDTYTGPVIYGGIIALKTNSTNASFSDNKIGNNSSGNDAFQLRFQSEGNLHAAFYFDKSSFLSGGDTASVSFDALSSVVFSTNRFENLGDVRWLVKEGNNFYVSEVTGNKFLSFTSNSSDGNWATYNPGSDLNFDQNNAVFSPQNFSDIQGIGLLIDKDDISNSRHWIEFDSFEFRGFIGNGTPPNFAPEVSFTNTPKAGRIPLEVSFDAGDSFDADGAIVSYAWNFGDGSTGSGETISHTYATTGSFTATLTVTDTESATASTSTTIDVDVANQAPVAVAFSAELSKDVPATFDFDAIDSSDPVGNIVNYAWDFGDGSTAQGLLASHEYTSAGIYTVTLTVTDSDGATDSDQLTVRATIGGNIPPVANISVDNQFGPPTLIVNFDGTGSYDPEGSIVSYVWDLGDGKKAYTSTTANLYVIEDTYNVSLIVTNNVGLTDTARIEINVSSFPSNNPISDAYGAGAYPWTDEINWTNVVNILDFAAVADGTTDNIAAWNAASAAVSSNGGGIVYFPAGTYYFADNMIFPSGVIIRGDAPVSGSDDAMQATFAPPTRFEFPAYVFTESGSGTPNSTAFKNIILDPSISTTANNVGIVYVDINRAGIKFSATDKQNATGENMVFYGIRTNNVGTPSPNVPNLGVGQNAYQRHSYRFTFNINAYNHANVLIANTRHNDNITDNYAYDSYIVDGEDGNPVDLTDGKALFNFTDHYVMEVGQGSGACLAGTPTTCPENFREGIDIRDNWMFHTMRVGIIARGQGLKIRNNVVKDKDDKVHWVRPTGDKIVGNATTLENRGIDWAGWDVLVENNEIEVYRHLLKTGPYLSIDGEGILIQECCGGTTVNGVDILGNTVNSYIGLYKMQDINDVLIANNTISTGDTDIDVIYVNANTNNANYKVDNTIIENNSVSGTLGNVLVRGTGAAGTGNIIRNNISTGGNMTVSCLVNATISDNTGFNINACQGPASRTAEESKQDLNKLGINIYPNPTIDILNVSLPNENLANIYLFNALGQNVYSNEAVSGDLKIQLAEFGKGIYIINIEFEGKITSKKIVVK